MSEQTDNLLYALVYAIPGCKHISDLRCIYKQNVLRLLEQKQKFYQEQYGEVAIQKAIQYVKG